MNPTVQANAIPVPQAEPAKVEDPFGFGELPAKQDPPKEPAQEPVADMFGFGEPLIAAAQSNDQPSAPEPIGWAENKDTLKFYILVRAILVDASCDISRHESKENVICKL